MKKTYLATAVAAIFASPITAAIAADTLLDDVVVSSSRSEQRSFDAPGSIQSVGREVIQSSGPQVNLSEALASVPGVTILNRQNYAQDLQVSIRGFGARTKFGVRGVRLIIDGIPATIPDGQGQSSSISLTSTDRIEVLRGPIAQLYGNSAGGVIQAFTREAPNQPELLVQGYLGSYGTNRTDWQYAQKVGQFGLVADYSTFKTDGFRQNSQAERNQFNGKFTYDHDDKTRISLITNSFDMPYAYDAKGLIWSDATTRPTYSTNASSDANIAKRYRKEIEQVQFGLVFDRKIDQFSDLKVYTYSGNRKNLHINAGSSFVGLDRDYRGVGLQVINKSTVMDKSVNYVFGSNYDTSDEINFKGDVDSAGNITNMYSGRKENRRASNLDFYGQGTMQISNDWSLTGGARSTSVKISSYDLNGNIDYGQMKYSAISPVVGLTYYALENLNIYANYGRGFETPTLAEIGYVDDALSSTTNSIGFNKSLKASRSNHYEFGLKWLPSNKSRVDLAVFYIKTQDEIVVSRVDGVDTSYRNIPGGTTRKGAELATQSLITDSTKAQLSLTYVNATFNQSFDAAGGSGASDILSGYKLPGIPQGQLYSSLQWSSSNFAKNKYKQIMGSTIGLEWISLGKVYVADNNTYVTTIGKSSAPGYSLYNLKISHRWDLLPFTLTATGLLNNLTDKRYIGSVIVGDTSAPFEPAPGRNWMLGLNATARF